MSAKARVVCVCSIHNALEVVSNVVSLGLTPVIREVISGFVGRSAPACVRYSCVMYSAIGAMDLASLADSFGSSSTLYARFNIVVKTSQMAMLISGR